MEDEIHFSFCLFVSVVIIYGFVLYFFVMSKKNKNKINQKTKKKAIKNTFSNFKAPLVMIFKKNNKNKIHRYFLLALMIFCCFSTHNLFFFDKQLNFMSVKFI
jgi:hypothetical protein